MNPHLAGQSRHRVRSHGAMKKASTNDRGGPDAVWVSRRGSIMGNICGACEGVMEDDDGQVGGGSLQRNSPISARTL